MHPKINIWNIRLVYLSQVGTGGGGPFPKSKSPAYVNSRALTSYVQTPPCKVMDIDIRHRIRIRIIVSTMLRIRPYTSPRGPGPVFFDIQYPDIPACIDVRPRRCFLLSPLPCGLSLITDNVGDIGTRGRGRRAVVVAPQYIVGNQCIR